MKNWDQYTKGFRSYLKIERSLSQNTVENYLRDVEKLHGCHPHASPLELTETNIRDFIYQLHDIGLSATSQNRILSGIKAFYKFLMLEDYIQNDPTHLFESARTERKFPETLSNEEIELLIGAIDLSKPEGERNKAIIETLYGCGLRVSELVGLRISDLHLNEGFIRVIGKGDKQRLVPIGAAAIKQINIYKNEVRVHQTPKPESRDILFLNRNGKQLTRVMIFTIIKRLAVAANIQKNISPHTLRHSFATELVQRGADLRAVQEMLGHESITTTEIYTHIEKQDLRDAIIQFHPRS
ncbi:MAG: tyrosine recombinase XerD [Crocinitomicaceae bacterium]|nr:tyrosine recombinase XerD [Crocinitomicaceae bacterium]